MQVPLIYMPGPGVGELSPSQTRGAAPLEEVGSNAPPPPPDSGAPPEVIDPNAPSVEGQTPGAPIAPSGEAEVSGTEGTPPPAKEEVGSGQPTDESADAAAPQADTAEGAKDTPRAEPVDLFSQKLEIDYQIDQAAQQATAKEIVELVATGKLNLDVVASSIDERVAHMSDEQKIQFYRDHPGALAVINLRSFRAVPAGHSEPVGQYRDLTGGDLSIAFTTTSPSGERVKIIGLRSADVDTFTFVVESRPGTGYVATADLPVERTAFYERILLDGIDTQQTTRRLVEVGRAAGKPMMHDIRRSIMAQVGEGKTLETKWQEFLGRHGGKIFVDEEMFVDLCKTGGLTHDFLSQKADEIGRDLKVRTHTIATLVPGVTVQFLDGTQQVVTADILPAVKAKLTSEVEQFEVDEKVFKDLAKLLEKGDQAYKDMFIWISEGNMPQAELTGLWEAIGSGDPDKVVDQLFMTETRRAKTEKEIAQMKKRKAAYAKVFRYGGFVMAALAIMAAMGLMSRER